MVKSTLRLTQEEVERLTEQVMTCGAGLQSIPDGLCEALAGKFSAALKSEHALQQMTTVQRRKSQAFVDVLKAAEEFRSACRSYASATAIIDPNEKGLLS